MLHARGLVRGEAPLERQHEFPEGLGVEHGGRVREVGVGTAPGGPRAVRLRLRLGQELLGGPATLGRRHRERRRVTRDAIEVIPRALRAQAEEVPRTRALERLARQVLRLGRRRTRGRRASLTRRRRHRSRIHRARGALRHGRCLSSGTRHGRPDDTNDLAPDPWTLRVRPRRQRGTNARRSVRGRGGRRRRRRAPKISKERSSALQLSASALGGGFRETVRCRFLQALPTRPRAPHHALPRRGHDERGVPSLHS